MSYRSLKRLGATGLIAVSMFTLGACSTPESLIGPTAPPTSQSPEPTEEQTPFDNNFIMPQGYTQNVLAFDTGSLSVATPDSWVVDEDSRYNPGEESFWKSSREPSGGDLGSETNPGVAIIYQDLEPSESEQIEQNFSTLPEDLLKEYDELTYDEDFQVTGASKTMRVSGTSEGINMNLVMILSQDKDTLAMVMLGYSDGDLTLSQEGVIVNSIRFTE